MDSSSRSVLSSGCKGERPADSARARIDSTSGDNSALAINSLTTFSICVVACLPFIVSAAPIARETPQESTKTVLKTDIAAFCGARGGHGGAHEEP
jgi:hypothetical protein